MASAQAARDGRSAKASRDKRDYTSAHTHTHTHTHIHLSFSVSQLKAKRNDCNSKATHARNDYLLTLAAANAHQDRYYKTDLTSGIKVRGLSSPLLSPPLPSSPGSNFPCRLSSVLYLSPPHFFTSLFSFSTAHLFSSQCQLSLFLLVTHSHRNSRGQLCHHDAPPHLLFSVSHTHTHTHTHTPDTLGWLLSGGLTDVSLARETP